MNGVMVMCIIVCRCMTKTYLKLKLYWQILV